ncbi:Cholesterol oxidase [Bradyrhizobium ivorense]|uniref:Cholesterol oxidase n=1 Tax=Bradyrhizobium ivorense TaxID=2511166 RepID=A0A508TGG2_9BRAD|nr:alkaline phosphatase D family protein [Bradyrhizobium ivorense]VIO73308.1 Cholesterol oxidase [Bradyrhizobium ivorense]
MRPTDSLHELPSTPPKQATWLSSGLESLIDECPWLGDSDLQRDKEYDFDVVIVGSGYGGAVAAAELSACTDENGRPLRLCVLERGREYLSGAFPSRQADLAGHVRFMTPDATRQIGAHDGLYDVRSSDDAVTVVASGLGGGSLINAGVMEMPRCEVFREGRWPHAIRVDETLFERAAILRRFLGARPLPATHVRQIKKTAQLSKLAKATLTPITVASSRAPNSAGVLLNECALCGDCATGCNHGAKDSLDLNLLALAKQSGARFVTGATVLRVVPCTDAGWVVHVNHTDNHLRDRQPTAFQLRTKRVILSAGTLGSTEILMRSQGALRFSAQLGRKFSANGDMLVTAYDLNEAVNAVADETEPPVAADQKRGGARAIGPTITAMIDLRTGKAETDVVIQDLAVPGALRRLFEEAITSFDVLNQLGQKGWRRAEHDCSKHDDAAVNRDAVKKSLVLAMIGRDDAEGELTLGKKAICDDADGLLTVRWPGLRMDRRFDEHHRRLREMMTKSNVGGRVVNNLLWRPFAEELERLFGRQRGPLITVHPLGGCAMGNDVRQGVTDHCGRVYDASGPDATSVHRGLVVLDGSIIPTSLGINPALTISVLSLRAITQLKTEWRLTGGRLRTTSPWKSRLEERPVYASPSCITNPKPTLIELTEQVRGCLKLRAQDGRRKVCQVQLTLTSKPAAISDLIADRPETLRGFRIDSGKARLQILKPGTDYDPVSDQADPDNIALEAEVSGELRLFSTQRSIPYLSAARALHAWLMNRGLRDAIQWGVQRIQEHLHLRPELDRPRPMPSLHSRARDFVTGLLSLCSRAGVVRLIEYDLTIGRIIRSSEFDVSALSGKRIRAVKRLTYTRASSPFTQLLEMSVETFPELCKPIFGKLPTLRLNKRYLARQQIPLLRVVDQQDGVASLIDLLSFVLYVFRVSMQSHALSFRRPDPPPERLPERLPGRLPDLPPPDVDWLTVDGLASPPARIRLTRYNGSTERTANVEIARPVLLLHGYSASGTTFAHPEVPGNLVKTLYDAGRDAWVLDMRCSAGLPSATDDWPFEVMADHDIPIAIEHIAAAQGGQAADSVKVDVVAHCMGAAMFSMAVLGDGPRQKRLHQRIGRVVFSQVGPVMILSRTNVLAAYIMRYARRLVSSDTYAFSPQEAGSLSGQLLDRALAAMSLPRHEFKRENPFWLPRATPWAGTRHRMDALYGRTFSLKNIPKGVLAKLDDFFGPISLETVSQVIHFATYNAVTDRRGVNHYVMPDRVSERFDFPLMSIHGEENGLVDVATLSIMRNLLTEAGVPYLNEAFRIDSASDAKAAREGLLDSFGTLVHFITSWLSKCFGLALSHAADRAGDACQTTTSQTARQIERLIDQSSQCLALGHPSYLTWRISEHGHQDCLIGKHAQTISQVIAKYLAAPDRAPARDPKTPEPARRGIPASYRAFAPAFGVRAQILEKAGTIRIQACDGAGRGSPLKALVLPVQQAGERFVILQRDGKIGIPNDDASLLQAGACILDPITKRKQEIGLPRFFEVPKADWPSHAREVLILLLYDQAEGIGGSARGPGLMKQHTANYSGFPIAQAAAEALVCDTIDDLRGGLLRGAITDESPQGNVTFAVASCLYPSDILNHMPAAEQIPRGPADASLLALSDMLGKSDSPSLLLLAGDQIYVDATAGLFDPKVLDERFRIPHERRGESRGAKAVMQRLDLEVQMMLDDHEIKDNWAPNDPDIEATRTGRTALQRGRSAYFLYERGTPKPQNHIWHKLHHRGLPFFLADARTERDARTAAEWRQQRIMGPRQFGKLCSWMIAPKHEDLPKFVMTASALLPRRLIMKQPLNALRSDAWDGYPRSLYSLLRFICDYEVEGLVFLSGDEHISSLVVASVTCLDTGKKCVFHSIHSSSLFAPYTFANGVPDDFIADDCFEFSSQSSNGRMQRYRCEAKVQFFPGDGFAVLTATQHGTANWTLRTRFYDAAGLKPDGDITLFPFSPPAS